ncbi:MAG: glycosyltransferase [Calditrichaeota bacterium]|nr:MAG: glycosyltransferase [Calditrichota bacterium]
MKIILSVVLISKNQDWNIKRLIESVLRKTEGIQAREILLVDSASDDCTTEIAQHYPINIIRLHDSKFLTPAAGRYVGFKHTTGDFILFLDGDMELCPHWLDKAMELIQNQSEIAAITGQRIDLPEETQSADKPVLPVIENDRGVPVEKGGGAAMYRRSTLDEIGQFNPYLCSDEEPDICLRIRYNGYKIIELKQTIVLHYSDPSDKLSTKIGRWRRNLYMGSGQNLRYNLKNKYLWPYIKERDFATVPLAIIIAGLTAFFWFLSSGESAYILFWLAGFAAFLVSTTLRRGSFYLTLGTLLHRILIIDGTVRGFFKTPLTPKDYPENFEILKKTPPEEDER